MRTADQGRVWCWWCQDQPQYSGYSDITPEYFGFDVRHSYSSGHWRQLRWWLPRDGGVVSQVRRCCPAWWVRRLAVQTLLFSLNTTAHNLMLMDWRRVSCKYRRAESSVLSFSMFDNIPEALSFTYLYLLLFGFKCFLPSIIPDYIHDTLGALMNQDMLTFKWYFTQVDEIFLLEFLLLSVIEY